VAFAGNIWTSSDSGVSWTERTVGSGSEQWRSITSSDDGTKLAAVVSGGNIWTSSDSGASWTERTVGGGSENLRSITSSDDGTKLAAVAMGGNIWTSSDSGVSWTERTVGGSSKSWLSITSSDDGTKLAAVVYPGNIWVSPAPLVPPEGCPDTINYVDTEGSFDLSVAAPTPPPGAGRDCTVLFRSPPGSVLAFDWKNFNVGSCSSESVILKDGWSDTESNKVGETLCGSSTPPSTTYFSGNTARLELKLESTSTFWIWVNHFRNHFTFDIPHSTFQLGSDISISYSLSLAQNSLPTSTYTLNAPSSASHPTDSGWVGLYRDGTCGTGAEAHECYLASRAAPAGENQVRFYFDDYKRAGWYEVRYFAGESAGTTCGVSCLSIMSNLKSMLADTPRAHKCQPNYLGSA